MAFSDSSALPSSKVTSSSSQSVIAPTPSDETPTGGDIFNGSFDIQANVEGDITSSAYYIGAGDIAGDLYAGQNGDPGNYAGGGVDQVFQTNITQMINAGDPYVVSVNNSMNALIDGPPAQAVQNWQQGVQTVVSGYNILGQSVPIGPGNAATGLQEFLAAAGNVGLDMGKAMGYAGASAAAGAVFIENLNFTAGALALTAAAGAISSVNDAVTTLESPLSANEQATVSMLRNGIASTLNHFTQAAESLGYGSGTNLPINP